MKQAISLLINLLFSIALLAQTFVEQTGVNNPFNAGGDFDAPTFVDIDNDGDFDAFTGRSNGLIHYYKNTGTNIAPAFIVQLGGNNPNPFEGVDVGGYSAPTFVDIDNDGDFDAFIGGSLGNINYYKNTGTNIVPTFTVQVGGNNPFDGVDVGFSSTPTFVDIDNDGDFDAFIGKSYGNINYYKNTGTNITPTFTVQTGGNNPFNGVNVGTYSTPTLVDIDNDGDFDAFIGGSLGNINYYKNTGTNIAPAFTVQTGVNNPFDGVDVGAYSAPTFVDIDNDGDFDAFIGKSGGNINYYKNTTVLPVELTYFKGEKTLQGTLLTWQTASEKNNEGFEVQRSTNGEEWEVLDFVEGNGTTLEVQNYTYTDEEPFAGNNYYRLKQIDFDGAFEYSEIVTIDYNFNNNQETSKEYIIFPNPVTNELNIIDGQGQATIYNLLGQPMKQFAINNEQSTIDVADLPKGQYILHILQENGTVATKRFVK